MNSVILMLNKSIIIFLLYLGFSDLALSQNTGGIRTIVKDSMTRESIPFAIIQIAETKLGAQSDVNGNCLLKNIPIGSQILQISAAGYKKTIRTVDIEPDQLLTLILYISPEPVMMQTVTKLSEKFRQNYETNISIQTLTQDELKIIPMTLEKDVLRTLKVLPGISTSGDVISQFFVRGGGGDQNLIIYDNMIIFNPFHALGLFSIFNGDVIKASDVITGGFNPEFGGRLSSVINITAKEGDRTYYGGKLNLGLLSGQLSVEGPVRNGAFSLSFRKSYFDKILKKFLSKEVPLSFYDFAGKTTFDISEQAKIYFNALLSGDDIIDSRLTQPNYSWKNQAFGITMLSFIKQFIFSTSFSLSNFKTLMDPKSQNENSKLQSGIDNIFIKIKSDFLFGDNDLFSFGCSILNLNTELSYINGAGYFINSEDNLSEMSLWLNYRYTKIKNLNIEFGIRQVTASPEKETFYNFEPRLNLKYQINDDLAMKASYTRMHQMLISTSNDNEVIPLFEALVPIKGKFYPERSDQTVFGIDYSFLDHFNCIYQTYYKFISNYLGYNLNRQSVHDPDFSSGEGTSYGCEVFLKFNFLHFFGWITYNLNWTNQELDGLRFSPRYDKRHSFNISLGTKLPLDIDFSLNWEGSSGMPFTPLLGYYNLSGLDGIPYGGNYSDLNERRTIFGDKNSKRLPFYHKLDLSFSKSFIFSGFPKINFVFDIINLYDQKNIFYYDLKTGERINMLPFLPSISLGAEL